jgi:hypothetical protein
MTSDGFDDMALSGAMCGDTDGDRTSRHDHRLKPFESTWL